MPAEGQRRRLHTGGSGLSRTVGRIRKGAIGVDLSGMPLPQYASSIAGSANKWCLNDGRMISIVIDDVGYYAVGSATDANYASIIDKIENPVVNDYTAFEIIQNFSNQDTFTRNSMWSRGLLATVKNPDAPDGATHIYQLSADDVAAGKDKVNGTPAFAVRMVSSGRGWGASHLINNPLPDATIEDISGVFFRMKTDSPHATALSVTTVGAGTQATGAANNGANPAGKLLTDADKNDNNACGNAGALLDEYSLTKNSENIRYYNADGELVGTGRVVPAGFDGYVFIEVENWNTYTKDGLTINWIDSDYKYVQQYVPSIAGSANKWCLNDGRMISIVIDDVGYYAVGSVTDANYATIIEGIKNPSSGGEDPDGGNSGEGSDEPGEFKYEMLNTFETEKEQNIGRHYCGDSYITEANALSGKNSMASTAIANDWAMYTLVREAPEPGFNNVTGFFFRFKVENDTSVGGNGDRQICTSTGTAALGDRQWSGVYAPTWGPSHGEVVFVWLNGDVERGFLVPDNFDGYVFVNSQTAMDIMYDNGYLQSLRVVLPAWSAWQNNPVKWKGSFLNFDNVGYFSVFDRTSNRVYQDLTAELLEKFPLAEQPDDYVPQMQNYITYEDETSASTEGSSLYYFKPYLYYHTEIPSAVSWSVVEGKATVKPLDDPEDATLRSHGAMIVFGSAGEVTIRAALRDDPTQYTDYTFTVKKDASKLDSAIFDVIIGSAYAEGEWASVFEQALDAARAVLMDEEVTQESYNDYIDFLYMLLAAYENGEPVPEEVLSSDSSAVPVPPTGEQSIAWLAALIILMLLATLYVLKKKARVQ